VILLLTGATDFLCFDRADLFESMNKASMIRGAGPPAACVRHRSRPTGVTPIALPDDGCLFCGVGLPVASTVMHFQPPVDEFKALYSLTDSTPLLDFPHPPPKSLVS
jgi:hypothetical protein